MTASLVDEKTLSTLHAEPETLSRRMRNGEVPMQGGPTFVDDGFATLIGGQLGLF